MPAPLALPPSVAYPSGGLTATPVAYGNTPNEGRQEVSFSIDWGIDGGTNNCILIDIAAAPQTRPISQIASVFIDNTGSAADVELLCVDTGFSLTIPARTEGTYPVFTKGTQVYVIAASAGTGDITRGGLLNFVAYPSQVAESQALLTAAVDQQSLTANNTQQLVAAGVNGVLEDLTITLAGAEGNAASVSAERITVEDGSGIPVVLARVRVLLQPGQIVGPAILYQAAGMNRRFFNGLSVVVDQAGTPFQSGSINVNAGYRT